tara:strand:- start:8116 stop:8322 length:207 start_codon:yes stop_codon:yes gene_type:complete
MQIDNNTTYNEVKNLEMDINKGLNALLTLQNYYNVKNLPIADLEQLDDKLFNLRFKYDKKRLIKNLKK